MNGEILVRAPRPRAAPDGHLGEAATAPIKMLEGLAHGEVAGGTDVTASPAAGEEPVRRPSTEAAQGGEGVDHRRVARGGRRLQVEGAVRHRAREVANVFCLARRE